MSLMTGAQPHEGALDPNVAIELPFVVRRRVLFKAQEPQRLAPLFTVALHGALEASLRELCCKPDCDGEPSCDHAWLVGPRVGTVGTEGVTDRAPGTLVISPSLPYTDRPILLEAGQVLSADLGFIGERAIALEPVVFAALGRAADRGFGAPLDKKASSRRARMELLTVDPLSPQGIPTSSRYVIDLRTPLRLKRLGHIAGASQVDATTLWEALQRRGTALARLCGAQVETTDTTASVPFHIESARLRGVTVRRHSSRQKRWLAWPGVVGTLVLTFDVPVVSEVAGKARLLLGFAAEAQLGKATSFGFGKLTIVGTNE